MRIEILRYLSDSEGYKPLNEFLKDNFKDATLSEIATILNEMYNRSVDSVIWMRGDRDFKLLGQKFIFRDWYNLRFYKEQPPKEPPTFYFEESRDEKDKDAILATLNNIPIEARITERGRKELEEYELHNSVKMVNRSVVKTNVVTLWIAGLAAFFALLSIIATLLKSDKLSVPQLLETNKLIQKQVQSLDSLRQIVQKFDSSRTKTK
jgi:hypothetical protein